MNLDLQNCYEDFLNYMEAERNASKATITSYITDFKVFSDFLDIADIEPRVDVITTENLRKYVVFEEIQEIC